VGGSEAKKGPGSDLFSPHRDTPKNVIKRFVFGFRFFVDFLVKTFRHDLKKNFSYSVLNSHLPSLRKTRQQKSPGKFDIIPPPPPPPDIKLLQKYVRGVFELLSLRNEKSPKKAQRDHALNFFRQAGGWVWDLADVKCAGGSTVLFAGPSQ
jgi:hypothetical protein